MVFALGQLFRNPGQTETLHGELSKEELAEKNPYSRLVFSGGLRFDAKLTGERGSQPMVYLKLSAGYSLEHTCDRCLKTFTKDYSSQFEHVVVRDDPEDMEMQTLGLQEALVVSDGRLDLLEVVLSDILLELPSKNLCDPECLGICPGCGKDLNPEGCDCGYECTH